MREQSLKPKMMRQLLFCCLIALCSMMQLNAQVVDVVSGLSNPVGVALKGNDLYISELGNNRISKIDITETTPTVTTVVNISSPTGLLIVGDELYINSSSGDRTVKIDLNDAMPTIVDVATGIDYPEGIDIDGNDLYIGFLNSGGGVKKVDLTTGVLTDVISNCVAGGLIVEDDELYFSEFGLFGGGSRVKKFNINDPNPVPEEVINGLTNPNGLTLNGNFLYISDRSANRIVRIDITDDNPTLEEVATGLSLPSLTAFDGLDMYFSQEGNGTVSKLELNMPVFSDLGVVCTGAIPNDLGGASPTGGTYFGPGVTDDGNGETFTFDPVAAGGLGTYTITYTAINGAMITSDLTVADPPTTTFTAPVPFSTDDGTQALTGGMPTGGVYTGTGVIDNEDGTYSFDPGAVGAGTYDVTYTFTDDNGCSDAAMAQLEVIDFVDGAALDFDGVDDRVIVPITPGNLSGNAVTIGGWVYPTNENNDGGTFDSFFGWRNDSSADFYLLQLNDTQLEARFRNSSGQNFDIVYDGIDLNVWQHYFLTYDGSTLTLYRDGDEVGSTTASGALANDGSFLLGYGIANEVPHYLDGQLDEIRILDVAIDCYTADQSYNCELAGTETNLVGYYQFNQDIANTNNTTLTATAGPDATLENFALMGMGSDFVEDGAVVTGTVCDPVLTADPSVTAVDGTDFGDVIIGQTGSLTFEVSNTGAGAFTLNSVSSSNPLFTISPATTDVTVATGATVSVEVIFSPTATGAQTADITFVTDDCAADDFVISVSGNGLALIEGAALDFDGVDDRVVLPAQDLISGITGDYTVSAWVNLDNNTVNQPVFTIVGNPPANTPYFHLSANSPFFNNRPSVLLDSGSGEQTIIGDGNLSANEWHHLLVSYDAAANTMTLYVDGEVAGSSSVTVSASELTGENSYIGFYPTNANVGGYYSGQIDELRFTNTSSNCYAVQQQSDCELSVDDPSLELYYQFNQLTSNPTVTTLTATAGPDGTMENFAYSGTESDFVVEGAVETGTTCDPVILPEPSVSGMGITIANGDDTPATDDGTDFGDVIVEMSQMATFEISNSSSLPFDVTSVTSSNPLFSVTPVDGVSVTNAMPVSFEVTFSPTAIGAETATITLAIDDCALEGTYTFTVQGNGAEVAIIPYGTIYIANSEDDNVSVIDPITNTVINTIDVGDFPLGMAASPATGKIYVTNAFDNNVSVINTAIQLVEATITAGNGPVGVVANADGSKIYVANQISNNVTVINTSTNMVEATIPAGNGPYGITISPDGSKVFVCNRQENTVGVINTATNTVENTIGVGSASYEAIVNLEGTKVYVANYGSDNISVIDIATNTVESTIPAGDGPFGLVLRENDTKLYVSNFNTNTIDIIDLATEMIEESITVGSSPSGMSSSADGNALYVSNYNSNNVSRVNPLDNTVVATIPVGSRPFAIGKFILTGTPGAALAFDGVDDQVIVPTDDLFAGVTDFTISTWVKLDEAVGNQPIFSTLNENNMSGGAALTLTARFEGNMGVPLYVIRSESGVVEVLQGTESLTAGQWHHLAFTLNTANSTATLYVDGVAVASSTSSSVTPNDLAGALTKAYIGHSPFNGAGDTGGYLNGQLDEFRITSTASNCYEIQQLSACELSADDPSLEVYYQFNQLTSNPSLTTLVATVGPNGSMENFAYAGIESNFVVEGAVETGTTCDPVASPMPSVTAVDGTDFGEVIIGENESFTFEVTNNGTGEFVLNSVTSSNMFFTIDPEIMDVTVGAGMTVTIEVIFTPLSSFMESADITFVTNDCEQGEIVISVTGSGVFPVCDPQASIDFNGLGNMITVAPGEMITASGTYEVSNPITCPTCIQQIIIGIEDDAIDCVYSEVPTICPELTTGSYDNFMITAPLTPGVYNVYSNNTFEFSCELGAYMGADGEIALLLGTITVEETTLIPGDVCSDAFDINGQFGQAPNEVQSSGPYNNNDATTDPSDPTFGWECFGEPDGGGGVPSLERTLWFSFVGDGGNYFIEALACGDDPIDFSDTQFAIYSGECDNLAAVLCSEDGPNTATGYFPAGDTLQTEAGVTYYMMVDGFGPDFPTDGEFCVEVTLLEEVIELTPVTFQVDASLLVDNGELAADGIHLAGAFNDFNGEPMAEGADNIWTLTLDIEPGTYSYKFQNGQGNFENIDVSFGEDCTVGGYGDREVVVADMALTTGLVCYSYCVTCVIVDIDEAVLEAGVSVFPNPAKEVLNVQIDLPQAAGNLNIRLVNTLGQVVSDQYFGQLQNDNIELDLSKVPAGAYMLQVRDGQSQFTQSVIVQK